MSIAEIMKGASLMDIQKVSVNMVNVYQGVYRYTFSDNSRLFIYMDV